MLGAAEGTLGVDHPVLSEQGRSIMQRRAVAARCRRLPWNRSVPAVKGGLEPGDELAAEHAAEHLDREEEAVAGSDPSSVVGRRARRQATHSEHGDGAAVADSRCAGR